MSTVVRDAAFVSVYNEDDCTELLYTTPAFASGFLPLEDIEDLKPTRPITLKSKRQPSETCNTGTTPPVEKKTAMKAAMKVNQNTEAAAKAAERRERRPSFIAVTPVDAHHEHHKDGHRARRHSSESHLPMSWWPESETVASHEWVERNDVAADEEEDILEEEIWAETFYD